MSCTGHLIHLPLAERHSFFASAKVAELLHEHGLAALPALRPFQSFSLLLVQVYCFVCYSIFIYYVYFCMYIYFRTC